jgi:hypothetical protein
LRAGGTRTVGNVSLLRGICVTVAVMARRYEIRGAHRATSGHATSGCQR